jgi:hypothetical protein
VQVARPDPKQYAQKGVRPSLIEPQLRNAAAEEQHTRVAPVSYLGTLPVIPAEYSFFVQSNIGVPLESRERTHWSHFVLILF